MKTRTAIESRPVKVTKYISDNGFEYPSWIAAHNADIKFQMENRSVVCLHNHEGTADKYYLVWITKSVCGEYDVNFCYGSCRSDKKGFTSVKMTTGFFNRAEEAANKLIAEKKRGGYEDVESDYYLGDQSEYSLKQHANIVSPLFLFKVN